MDENNRKDNGTKEAKEFKGYALKRIVVGIAIAAGALWIFGAVLGIFGSSPKTNVPATVSHPPASEGFGHGEDALVEAGGQDEEKPSPPDAGHTADAEHEAMPSAGVRTAGTGHEAKPAAAGHPEKASVEDHGREPAHTAEPTSHAEPESHVASGTQAASGHAEAASETHAEAETEHGAEAGHGEAAGGHGDAAHGTVFDPNMPAGVAFIDATMKPLAHELNERWWGWRPNDIVDITDNVNQFQLGVLEVTRRTAVVLAERISRTGSTAAFDPNLENAMNWFMIKADRYWFPSTESKYKAGLEELMVYRDRLVRGEAKFYTRTDNLIPLLMAFEDLMGSCDENLVKHFEDDGSHVSYFSADDYFYYTKGVASAMHSILEAVQHDFATVVESRRGAEVLHHAIESCREAMEIDPILVLNSGWGSIFANHRANLAAPISHARFYLGVLIKTLST